MITYLCEVGDCEFGKKQDQNRLHFHKYKPRQNCPNASKHETSANRKADHEFHTNVPTIERIHPNMNNFLKIDHKGLKA